MGNTVHLSAIRCFPFLFLKHSPSYRQRKRSLGSASDDDTGNVLFPHILCMMHGIAIPHAVISSAARNLFRPPFPSSFAKPFTGNTVRFSVRRCFPFLAVRRSPSYRQRKRSLDFARDDDTRNAPFPLSAIRCFRFLLSDMHHKQKSHERLCSWLFHMRKNRIPPPRTHLLFCRISFRYSFFSFFSSTLSRRRST